MNRTVRVILAAVGVLTAAFLVVVVAVAVVFWNDVSVRARNMVDIFTNEPGYAEGFSDRGEMLDYLSSHPDEFSLVVLEDGGERMSHLPEEASPLASTKKIVILAAYEKEVASGNLDPKEEIAVSEWERYYIPNTDGGAHPAALEHLEIEADDLGYATDEDAAVTLDDLATAMISVSDNAATDYLIQRLGQEKIDDLIEREDLTGQQSVIPISGALLLWNGPDGDGTPGLSEMDREEYTSRALEAAEEYADGGYPDEWREGRAPLSSLRQQREMAARYETSGTTRDYARIMDGVASGDFVSPEVSRSMAGKLDWPMESESNRREYETLATKGGSLPGIYTQAMYAVPKNGDYAGRERVAVMFVREMSSSAWLGAQQSEGYSEFVVSLLTDRKFSERVEREMDRRR